MAGFLVPAAEAVITTAAAKVIKSREKEETVKLPLADGSAQEVTKISFSTKLGWLNKLLWGGSALLAFEHVWHGELTAWFPFLTAASNPVNFTEMLHEMSTVGVAMSVLVTAVWGAMVLVTNTLEKRVDKERIPMK